MSPLTNRDKSAEAKVMSSRLHYYLLARKLLQEFFSRQGGHLRAGVPPVEQSVRPAKAQSRTIISNFQVCEYVLFVSLLVISIAPISTAKAHKVKIAADVGATLHIEPNDNPRAGEPAKTWFALTRKGGEVIPLKDCNCQLAVYAEPHTPGEPALLEPSLKPVSAERYQGTPGTEITFPKPGAYQLQLSGKPATGASFKPFELKFEVTVAAGSSVQQIPQNIPNVNNDAPQNQSQQIPVWAIALPILAIIGISYAVLQSKRGGRG